MSPEEIKAHADQAEAFAGACADLAVTMGISSVAFIAGARALVDAVEQAEALGVFSATVTAH